MKQRAAIAPDVVLKRINRRLAGDGLSLRKARGIVVEQLGEFFLVSREDKIARRNVDLESVAREKGALEAWETVAC